MQLEVLRWNAPDTPTEESVRQRLEDDGFDAGAAGATYVIGQRL